MEGIAKQDGQGNQRVPIQFDGTVIEIKAERLIVLEIGPEGPTLPQAYPHPVTHNYLKNRQSSSTKGPQLAKKTLPPPKKEPAPNPITTCCSYCEGTGTVIHTYSGSPMPCPQCKGKVTEVPGEESSKENRMAQKEAQRKKRSDWNFD
jgi:hypothetical protein